MRVHFVDRVGRRMAYPRAAWRMLLLNLGPQRFDLIHAQTGHCGALARLQFRYPVLTSYVGYDVYGKQRTNGGIAIKSRVEAWLFRNLARTFAATITKSRGLSDALPASARPRDTVLPNGVDRRLFRPLARQQARERLGWSLDGLVVLFVGDPKVPRKRFRLAEEACARARESFPELSLRVCSGVPVPRVPLWMNAADVLLLTSLAEGSPNAVKEAMACNLPIVAVDVGDVRDVISGTERCRVTDDSSERLGDALVEVLADAPARTDGRDRTAHLSLETIAARLLQIYEQLVAVQGSAGAAGAPAPWRRAHPALRAWARR